MVRSANVFGDTIAGTGEGQRCLSFVSSLLRPADSSVVEKAWFMSKLVSSHGVHRFGRNLVVSQLDICLLSILIDSFKTLIISKNLLTLWLLGGGLFVVIAGQLMLTWFQHTVRLISVRSTS